MDSINDNVSIFSNDGNATETEVFCLDKESEDLYELVDLYLEKYVLVRILMRQQLLEQFRWTLGLSQNQIIFTASHTVYLILSCLKDRATRIYSYHLMTRRGFKLMSAELASLFVGP